MKKLLPVILLVLVFITIYVIVWAKGLPNGHCGILKRSTKSYYEVNLARYKNDNGKLVGINTAPTSNLDPKDDVDGTTYYVMGQHSVMQDRFEDMIGKFFILNPNGVPIPKTIDTLAIIDSSKHGNCFVFSANEHDVNSNAEIAFIMRNVKTFRMESNYSRKLLLGVIHTYQPDHIDFFKAIDGDNYTIAFAAIRKGLQGQADQVLYLGELSGLYP